MTCTLLVRHRVRQKQNIQHVLFPTEISLWGCEVSSYNLRKKTIIMRVKEYATITNSLTSSATGGCV